jgi:hypothetical protein
MILSRLEISDAERKVVMQQTVNPLRLKHAELCGAKVRDGM